MEQPAQPISMPPKPVAPVVSSEKKISKKVPVLIGLCIAGLAIVLLLSRGGLTKASDEKPANVTFTPTSANSMTVTWSTGSPTLGQILLSSSMDTFLGKSSTDSTPDYHPEDGDPKTDHSVTLDSLHAGGTYYMEIQIGDTNYDNSGVAWSFTMPTSDEALSITPAPTKSGGLVNPFSNSPTPIQHLQIPDSTGPTSAATCSYTACADIKAHFGQGCTTKDYIACLKK